MTAILQSQIFFFISSIGFVVLGFLAVIVLIYILRALLSFSNILKRAEKDIDSIGDTTKEMLEEIQDSGVFQFIFKRKRKRKEIGGHK